MLWPKPKLRACARQSIVNYNNLESAVFVTPAGQRAKPRKTVPDTPIFPEALCGSTS